MLYGAQKQAEEKDRIYRKQSLPASRGEETHEQWRQHRGAVELEGRITSLLVTKSLNGADIPRSHTYLSPTEPASNPLLQLLLLSIPHVNTLL